MIPKSILNEWILQLERPIDEKTRAEINEWFESIGTIDGLAEAKIKARITETAINRPTLTTKVVHSQTKPAWNVVTVKPLGYKYKIARVPYEPSEDSKANEILKNEAYEQALFISFCLNQMDSIVCKIINW